MIDSIVKEDNCTNDPDAWKYKILPDPFNTDLGYCFSIFRRSDKQVIYKSENGTYNLHEIIEKDEREHIGERILVTEDENEVIKEFNKHNFEGIKGAAGHKTQEQCSLDDPENCEMCSG